MLTTIKLFFFVNIYVYVGFKYICLFTHYIYIPTNSSIFIKNKLKLQFAGHWYEIERSFYILELAAGCTTIEIQENLQGRIEVVARVINKWFVIYIYILLNWIYFVAFLQNVFFCTFIFVCS